MAEKKKADGKGLKTKAGPLPVWGWVAVGGGIFLAFRLLKSRGSSGGTVSTALTGGTTIPAAGSGGSSGLPSFSSFAAWEQAAISAMANGQLSPADALNGLTDWINGQCVSQSQYQGIGSIIETVGLPPGFTQVPALTMCAGSTSTGGGTGGTSTGTKGATPGAPPNLAQSLIAAMTSNGEHVVDVQYDPKLNEWLYLTQRGGIYALNPNGTNGTQFYGSGLSSALNGAFNGRTAQHLTIGSNGQYTITDTTGSNYTFGPGAGQNYAGATVH